MVALVDGESRQPGFPAPRRFAANIEGLHGTPRALRTIGMGIIGSYRDLDVWAASMDLVDGVFRHSQSLPRQEFELRSQMKRAVISIPANVAEGWCRKDRRQAYQNHVSIAMGSRGELDTELEICFRNGLLNRANCGDIEQLMGRVRPMLARLYDSI